MIEKVSGWDSKDRIGAREVWGALAVALVWVGISAHDALARPMWYDEIFTYYGSGIGSLRQIVDLLFLGFDPTPVLFYAISATVRPLGPPELVLRLPGIVGFATSMVCAYLAARRHAGVGPSALAAVVPAILFGDLNLEARPYGLVLGFAGLSLLGWTYRDRHPRLGSLFFLAGILFAAGCHYYAFLVGMPFATAALWQFLRTKKFDLLTFAGSALALVPNLRALPLIRADIAMHSPGAWNSPSWRALVRAHAWEFGTLAALLLMLALWRRLPVIESDLICWLGFAALPFVGTLLAKSVSGMIHPRYTSFHTLGVGLVLGWALERILQRRQILEYAAASIALIGLITALFFQAEKTSDVRLKTDQLVAEIAELLARPEFRNTTLAVPDTLLALPISYYSTRALRPRIVFPADSKLSLQYLGNNSAHLSQERLHNYVGLRTEAFVTYFEQSTESILVLNTYGGASFFDQYLRSRPEVASRATVLREYPFGSIVLVKGR